jgi:thiol-disulfide isomerase/thioredoxin
MNKVRVTLTIFLSVFATTFVLLAPLSSASAATESVSPADQALANAESTSAEEHKMIFLEFGASWCGPCHRLDAFLAAPETSPVIRKYFVVAKLHVDEKHGKHPELETPGADALRTRLGGEGFGVPFIVFLDPTGKPIANSIRLVNGHAHGNVGYPAEPEEIDWFMEMLKSAVPSMTEDESRTVEEWLRQRGRR